MILRKYFILFSLPFCLFGNIKTNYETIKTRTSPVSASQNRKDTIEQLYHWRKNMPLSWDLYLGVPDTVIIKGATAISYIGTLIENFKVYGDSVVMDLTCYINKYKSWVLVLTNKGLIHEQGHFDIGEVITRKARRDISNYISIDNDASTKFYQSVSDKYFIKENSELNELYDKETDFGRNTDGQKRWNVKIDSMLMALEAYSNPHVVVKRIIKR